MPLYADDYEWVIQNPASKLSYYFTHANPHMRFYRPIQMSTSAIFQAFFGWQDTFPNHVFQLTMHVMLSFLIYIWMRKIRWSRLQGLLASLFMLIAQTNVLTVARNDTSSEITSTLFGCAALWLYYSYLHQDTPVQRGSVGLYAASIVFYGLSLFSKESGVSFLLALALLLVTVRCKDRLDTGKILGLIRSILPYAVVTCLYLLLRSQVVTYPSAFGNETYNFNIGTNIIVNLGQFTIFGLVPLSTARYFVAIKQHDEVTLGLAIFGYLIFFSAISYGLLLSGKPRPIIAPFLLVSIAIFPVVLLNHINEQYFYKAMPFICALVGIGLGELLARRLRMPVLRITVSIVLIILAARHVLATIEKVGLMRDNGERAQQLLIEVLSFVPHVPHNGRLLLLDSVPNMIEYSMYYM